MTLRQSLCAVSLAVAASLTVAAQAPAGAFVRSAFDEQVDGLLREGFERPAEALVALETLHRESALLSVDQRRTLLQSIGSIEAQTGAAAKAGAIAEQLLALAAEDPSGRSVAAASLVRAQLAENADQLDVAAALALSALPAFQAGCPGAAAPAANALACDYRSAWRALQVLERRAVSAGVPATATVHAKAALALAEWAGDARRQSSNLSSLAVLAQQRGERELALRLSAQAKGLALKSDDLAQQALAGNGDARIAEIAGDRAAALRAREEALAMATLADTPRLQAQMLINLSDAYARLQRPADALRAAQRALAIVRRHKDLRLEAALASNAGVARIGLGRVAEGKQDLARVLDFWQQSGATGRQAEALLEFGEALGAAGDARGALELYHRERALSTELMHKNRSVALKELQTRSEAEARQRDIELLGRDNALKTEALANRDLVRRIWWLVAAVMVLAIALVALLYRRVRETHRRLAASHLQLQAQSERDPLTKLSNRRHFQSVMTGLCAGGHGFEGALLLVDIDHFKRVNDEHGHAAGDEVLVEVARRLNDAVRGGDLVVRWGGEEFLIVAPRAAPEQVQQMAERMLRVLGETPMRAGAPGLRVTASIGYARFPLPPYGTDVPWEQAVNLADMALYTAKNQGRNRAVGITSTTAATREALADIEADFDRARHEGRVTLLQTPGPELRDNVRAA